MDKSIIMHDAHTLWEYCFWFWECVPIIIPKIRSYNLTLLRHEVSSTIGLFGRQSNIMDHGLTKLRCWRKPPRTKATEFHKKILVNLEHVWWYEMCPVDGNVRIMSSLLKLLSGYSRSFISPLHPSASFWASLNMHTLCAPWWWEIFHSGF